MICSKCKRIGVLHAFSNSNCIKCNDEIVTPHKPPYKLCKKCSLKYGVCEQCGGEINVD